MEEKIRSLVNDYLAPLVEKDGGKLELVGVEGTTVRVRLSGTCRGCPGQPLTLEQVIEPTLRECVDTALTVEAVD